MGGIPCFRIPALLVLTALAAVLTTTPSCAGVLDDLESAVATLRRPRVEDGRQGSATGLELPLAAGALTWERGSCRVLPVVVGGDSLWVVEISGRGWLRLAFEDPLEQIALRAAAGRKAGEWRLRGATLVLDAWPADWPDWHAWQPLARRWPRRPPRPVEDHGRLERLGPDHPLLDDPTTCWLSVEPDGWLWREEGGGGTLLRPLHEGSSLDVPVALAPPATRPAGRERRALREGTRPARLHLEGNPRSVAWDLLLDLDASATWTALRLDPAVQLDAAAWEDGRPARVTRGLAEDNPGPWLMVETPAAGRLHLAGSSPRGLLVDERPGVRRAGRAAWFPVPGDDGETRHLQVEDPDSLLAVWQLEEPVSTDARAAVRLLPEERKATPLGGHARLCWTPLRRQAEGHLPEPVLPPRHVPRLEDLELPRERDVRPPSRETLREPADPARGADTLSLGILQEEDVLAELALAAGRLEGWLGAPPRPVTLLERQGPEPDRREELDQLLRWTLPPEEPLEIGARILRSGAPEDRLRRLEGLCRGWWLPCVVTGEASPRWIRHGAARACALRLLELDDAPTARRLREEALGRQLSAFRPHAAASLPALGERAEGTWWNGETQDGLAWRFALLLEHLRWRLRDPSTLDDTRWLHLMAGLAPRLQDPVRRDAPLEDLKQALADGLVAEGALEAAGFLDVREFWAWLASQWRSSTPPGLRVERGQVDTAEGPRLALHAVWSQDPTAGTAIPVLVRGPQGLQAFTLRASLREERYVLPLDPAEVEGLEVAPGATLPARLTVR